MQIKPETIVVDADKQTDNGKLGYRVVRDNRTIHGDLGGNRKQRRAFEAAKRQYRRRVERANQRTTYDVGFED